MRFALTAFYALAILTLVLPLLAPGESSASSEEERHLLSIGGGIASPSSTSALGENPSGLIYNSKLEFLGSVESPNSSFNPMGYGALLYFGNGSVGGGLGLQAFNGQGAIAGTATVFNYGLAAKMDSANLAFGFAGTYVLTNSGSAVGSTRRLDLGMIYNPKGKYRLGATVFQILDSVEAIAIGIAADANSNATFVLDTSTSPRSGGGTTATPGLAVTTSQIQMSIGYGIELSRGDTVLRKGVSLGLGLKLNDSIHLEGYYNHLAQYFAGITIGF